MLFWQHFPDLAKQPFKVLKYQCWSSSQHLWKGHTTMKSCQDANQSSSWFAKRTMQTDLSSMEATAMTTQLGLMWKVRQFLHAWYDTPSADLKDLMGELTCHSKHCKESLHLIVHFLRKNIKCRKSLGIVLGC